MRLPEFPTLRERSGWRVARACVLFLVIAAAPGAAAADGTPLADHWTVGIAPCRPHGLVGAPIGIDPQAADGWDRGYLPFPLYPDDLGILLLLYKENGPDWEGPTGFYWGDKEKTPIPPGGSKTWSEFVYWSQNYTPGLDDNGVVVEAQIREPWNPPPAGYMGHLVIDQIPSSVNWTGPTDYWLDLTTSTIIRLPLAEVTDPLQGTKFHLTVYAPIPEPASLLALAGGLAALGLRKRRR